MKNNSPIHLTNGELAWSITDALNVINGFCRSGMEILGGDIINPNLEYCGDNWYYKNNPLYSVTENVERSYEKAFRYLNDYILYNGEDYYVSIVTRKRL